MATKWNDKGNRSISFQVEMNEETKAFFERMMKEEKDREEIFKERIKQLFEEHFDITGGGKETYDKIFNVFARGYQCGWNDLHHLNEEE